MPPPIMRDVHSSNVDRIGHDMQTNELYVQWQNGRKSIYSDVPATLADDVMNAWSVGKALNERIKPHYQHRYLGDE